VELAGKRRCFVVSGGDPEPRDIALGSSNDRMVEVKDGLKEGDQVVLNPKHLVGDMVKTRKAGDYSNVGSGNGRNGSAPARDRGPGAKPPGMPPGPGGPGAAPGGSGAPGAASPKAEGGPGAPGAPAGGQQLSAEDRQKRAQEMFDRFKKASPEERKQMLEQVPEAYRDRVKEALKAQGLEVK
jgi:hypothetical protein